MLERLLKTLSVPLDIFLETVPHQLCVSSHVALRFEHQLDFLLSCPSSSRYAQSLMSAAFACVYDVGSLNSRPKYLLLPTTAGKVDAVVRIRKHRQYLELIDGAGEFEYELCTTQNGLFSPIVPVYFICREYNPKGISQELWKKTYVSL
jgi:hypothetical protein